MSAISRPRNAGGPPVPQPRILQPRQSSLAYFYIYDEVLSEPKHANTLARIETRLTDLELQGRVGRLGPLKSAKEMVHNAMKAGTTTIVAVGNDRTIAEAINAMAEGEATLGIIPVGHNNDLAVRLGIPEGESACEVLAARKVETLDLGKAGHYYFLTAAEITSEKGILVECDNRYAVEVPPNMSRVAISNLETGGTCQDGLLELFIESTKKGGWFRQETSRSVVAFREARVSAIEDEGTILAEGIFNAKLPQIVSIIPAALKIIVGRDRTF